MNSIEKVFTINSLREKIINYLKKHVDQKDYTKCNCNITNKFKSISNEIIYFIFLKIYVLRIHRN